MKKQLRMMALILSGVLFLGGCQANTAPELLEPVGVNVDTAVVTREKMYQLDSFNSSVVPFVQEVYFDCSGTLSQSMVSLGKKVKKGEVLATLDTEELEKQIQSVKEQMAFNEKNDAYTRKQLEIGVEIARLRLQQLKSSAGGSTTAIGSLFSWLSLASGWAMSETSATTSVPQSQAESEIASEPEESSETPEVSSEVTSSEPEISSEPETSVPEVSSKPEEPSRPAESEPESSEPESSQPISSEPEPPAPAPPQVSKGDIVLAEAELDAAELALSQGKETQALQQKQLEEQLESLNQKMGDTKIKAPFDGIIAYESGALVGDHVQAYTPMFCVADESKLSLSGQAIGLGKTRKSNQIVALIDGKEYDVTYREYNNEEYTALVLSGNEVPARFDFNGKTNGLKVGQYANIYIYSNIVENALTLPVNALLGDFSTGYYVYRMEDHKPVRCSVKVGVKNSSRAEITEGLQEGDVVYVQS